MINRTLLRTKVVQLLFAYYKSENKSLLLVEKELLCSFQKTYDLYFMLLQLIVDVTRFAQQKIEMGRNKLLPTEEDLHPNMRFANNLLAAQLETNMQLNKYLQTNKLSWTEYPDIIKGLFQFITSTDLYNEYMTQVEVGYEHDKQLWRRIFTKYILEYEDLEQALEEQSIYWVADLDVVNSFVIKTIKKFTSESGDDMPLLPMFTADDDADFARKLLRKAIENAEEYQQILAAHISNWDFQRVAYMDTILMQVAMAELMNFPTIPIEVTLNEYIDISKEYSTEKSAQFINGVLDDVVGALKNENKLTKAVLLNEKKK